MLSVATWLNYHCAPCEVGSVLLTVTLSILDGALTLESLHFGAEEINPVMAYYLSLSPTCFMMMKHYLTSVSLILFLLTLNASIFGWRIRGKHLLLASPFLYAVPVIYQTITLSNI